MESTDRSLPSSELELGRHDGFAERLRSLADDRGSVSALAKAAGISQSGLQRYLNGGEPSRKALIAIALACNVSLDWLAMGRGDQSLLRYEPHQEGGYVQEPDDFVYIEEMATAGDGTVSTRHAVRRDWLMARGLEPARLRFLQAREDALAPTIQPGDRLLCETFMHRTDQGDKIGLTPGELPPESGIYWLRLGDKGPTALRRLRLDMGGGLVLSADADQSLHLHLQGEDQLRRNHILARAVALWRDL